MRRRPDEKRRFLVKSENNYYLCEPKGEVQEWLNWPAWKASKPLKGFRGSNPLLSARKTVNHKPLQGLSCKGLCYFSEISLKGIKPVHVCATLPHDRRAAHTLPVPYLHGSFRDEISTINTKKKAAYWCQQDAELKKKVAAGMFDFMLFLPDLEFHTGLQRSFA